MSEPIRVMHFRRTAQVVGGPETLIISVAKYIDRAAFDVTAIDFGPTPDARTPFLNEIDRHGIATAAIPASHKFDFRPIKYLAGLLEQRRIDVLHTHDHRSNFIGYLATRRRPTPIVTTFHQPLRRYWWLRHIEILDDHLVRRFDRVLPVAEAVRDEILAKRPDLADRVLTVLNGVDLDLFKTQPDTRQRIRTELGIPPDAFLCATIGRVMEDKGLNYLVDAQQRVSRRRDDVYQLIVGIGPQMESLQARVRRLGLADRIRFTGHRRDIPEILDASDLLVVCSLSEGLSVAILEAMAAGRAVVATRVGGTPEIVIHDETGLIIEPRDRDALADAILYMAGNPAKRSAMAQRARELAFEKWSVERMVRRFEDVYRDLIEERRARTR